LILCRIQGLTEQRPISVLVSPSTSNLAATGKQAIRARLYAGLGRRIVYITYSS